MTPTTDLAKLDRDELDRKLLTTLIATDELAYKFTFELGDGPYDMRPFLRPLLESHARMEEALRAAHDCLAGWCDAVDNNGTGWDDWDEWFKSAKYERYGKPSVLSVIRTALESPHEA